MSVTVLASLAAASQQIFICVGLPLLLLGLVGNLLNVLVFLSLHTFRQNSCAFYLTAMSMVNIGQLITGLLTRVMSGGYGIDWTQSSLFYCKFRIYAFQVTTFVSLACMCLASIDQYFVTCARRRWQLWCNVANARRLLAYVGLILLVEQLPGLIFFDQISRFTPTGVNTIVCTVTNTAFIQFNNYFNYLLLGNVAPYAATFSFGLLAYRNVKQLAHRAVPLVRRELDRQLTAMVLVQIVYNFVTLLPNLLVYLLLSYGDISDQVTRAQISLAQTVTTCLYYAYFAGPFYIYVGVSERFRRQLSYVLFHLHCKGCRQQRVIPEQHSFRIHLSSQ